MSAGAKFCSECGASEDSGWNQDVEEGFGAEDDFDYDDYLEREFGTARPRTTREKFHRVATVAIIIFVCISLTILSIVGM
ncbi:MAG: hypothetical protein H6822_27210 [Planctomycetaceae bacterium]|nr:hypothetical protein [Planctomycetales bacterium]MCB9925868.1 hypothetical protein [Planctomycetaceae bacterium]